MLTGAILVGGNNDTVNGTLKSFFRINKKTIIDLQIAEMRKICLEILVVTNQPKNFLPFVPRDIRIITDYRKGKGPLGGLHAALSLANHSHVWVVGCDMPFISFKVARSMFDLSTDLNFQAVLPALTQKLEPNLFHSVYQKSILPEIENSLVTNTLHPSHILNQINWVKLDTKFFISNDLNPNCIKTIASDTKSELTSLLLM